MRTLYDCQQLIIDTNGTPYEARLLPGERVWQTESLFLVFRQSKVGVAEMGVVTMLKLAGYYLYSYTDLVRFERFSVLEITFLVDVYRNLS